MKRDKSKRHEQEIHNSIDDDLDYVDSSSFAGRVNFYEELQDIDYQELISENTLKDLTSEYSGVLACDIVVNSSPDKYIEDSKATVEILSSNQKLTNGCSIGNNGGAISELMLTSNKMKASTYMDLPDTPETREAFKKLNEVSTPERTEQKSRFAYMHTQNLLQRYILRRIQNDIYEYRFETGAFNILNDNDLKTLIHTDCSEETAANLSKFEVADIVERLQTEPTISVPYDYFDKNEGLINFLNGTLEVASGNLIPHSAEFKLTHYINANYIYDYTIVGTNFNALLQIICKNDSCKVDHLQEIMGYILSSYSKVKKAVVFNGVKHSGKSTILRFIQKLLGPENVSNFSLAALDKRFVTGKLLTKQLNIYGERGATNQKDIETFKAITGGDWMETENKSKDFINHPPKTKLLYAGNEFPIYDEVEDMAAFIDRSTIFIFSNAIDEKNRMKDFDDLLLLEKDAIVSWAMDGLMRFVKNNFIFNEAYDSVALRRSKLTQVGPIEDFLAEYCDMKDGSKVFSVDLYRDYCTYCKDNLFDVLSSRCFITEIIAKTEAYKVVHKKIRIGKQGPYMGFEGLGIKNEQELGSGTMEHGEEFT